MISRDAVWCRREKRSAAGPHRHRVLARRGRVALALEARATPRQQVIRRGTSNHDLVPVRIRPVQVPKSRTFVERHCGRIVHSQHEHLACPTSVMVLQRGLQQHSGQPLAAMFRQGEDVAQHGKPRVSGVRADPQVAHGPSAVHGNHGEVGTSACIAALYVAQPRFALVTQQPYQRFNFC